MRKVLATITSPTAFNALRDNAPDNKGLHSQTLFGPLTTGSCACGKYRKKHSLITCERCGVTTSPLDVRSTTYAHIYIGQMCTPVIPAGLRPPSVEGSCWTFDQLDRIYTEMLVLSTIEVSLPDLPMSQYYRKYIREQAGYNTILLWDQTDRRYFDY